MMICNHLYFSILFKHHFDAIINVKFKNFVDSKREGQKEREFRKKEASLEITRSTAGWLADWMFALNFH